jgi:hypothetical protein
MVSFLFWNLFKKPLLDRVIRLVRTNRIDILTLTECVIDKSELEETLRREVDASFSWIPNSGGKLEVFTRLPAAIFQEAFNNPFGGMTI